MDPVSQGVLGAVAAQSVSKSRDLALASVCGVIAGMAADLDALIGSSSDPLLYLEYHRQFTHALIFVPFGALICAGLIYFASRRAHRGRTIALFCLAAYATHGLLDACTSYGTQLLWPFSSQRVAWHTVSIIDPLFTLPLLICAGLAYWRRRALFARCGLLFAFLFMLVGSAQGERAQGVANQLAAARGHQAQRLLVKPSFANLLVWKMIYEHSGRYYVDAVRLGAAATIIKGTSIAVLDPHQQLPWLDPSSQQARDLERFNWFSDGYLALHPQRSNTVIDMRYSMLPNEIEGLWGIVLDANANAASHVKFEWTREVSRAQRQRLTDMVLGRVQAN